MSERDDDYYIGKVKNKAEEDFGKMLSQAMTDTLVFLTDAAITNGPVDSNGISTIDGPFCVGLAETAIGMMGTAWSQYPKPEKFKLSHRRRVSKRVESRQ